MLPLPEPKRAAGRRLAEALLNPLVRGVRVVTGRAPAAPPLGPPDLAPPPAEPTPEPTSSGDAAAARIDAARERLRSKIAPPPADDDPAPPPD